MAADFAVRYGDTLKVHQGQLTQGLNKDGSPKNYLPAPDATILMVMKKVGGSRVNLPCIFDVGLTTWSRIWTTNDFTALGSAPTSTISFSMYLEVTSAGSVLTFPDDPAKNVFQVDLLAPL